MTTAVPILSGSRCLKRPITSPRGMPRTSDTTMAVTPIWMEMGSFSARICTTGTLTR